MKKIRYYVPTIVFNVAETAIIILGGIALNLSFNIIAFSMLLYVIVRLSTGKAKHYKSWVRCLVWSTLMFLSVFVVAQAHIVVCALAAILCALATSETTDISKNGIYQFAWKPKDAPSIFQDAFDIIRPAYSGIDPPSEFFVKFENYLANHFDERLMQVYRGIFVSGRTMTKVAHEMGIETRTVTELCKSIERDFWKSLAKAQHNHDMKTG